MYQKNQYMVKGSLFTLFVLSALPAWSQSTSKSPVKVPEPNFKIRPEFRHETYSTTRKSVSYAKRYELFCRKLVLERLYQSACFIMSDREGGLLGKYTEPASDLRFKDFVASLVGKMAEYAKSKELG